MDLSKKVHEDIKAYFIYAIENPNVELELLFNPRILSPIKDRTFKDIFKYFKNSKGYSMIHNGDESLVIKIENNHQFNSFRTVISSIERIHYYCQYNKLLINNGVEKNTTDKHLEMLLRSDNNIGFDYKSRVKDKPSISIDNYYIYVNLKTEISLNSDDDNIKKKIKLIRNIESNGSMKHYRYRKRFTFLSPSKLFKIDLTLVKQSPEASQTLFNSGILNEEAEAEADTKDEANVDMKVMKPRTYKYEIEIELNNSYITSLNATERQKLLSNDAMIKIIGELFKITGNILRIIQGNYYLMSKTETEHTIMSFFNLIDKKMTNYTMKNLLIGPKPVGFSKKHLLEPRDDRISILKHYTVTDKADGLRHLLYIHSDMRVYLINNNSISYTGLKHQDAMTLIDGELIKVDKYGNKFNTFMAFDVYYYKKELVANLPLMHIDSKTDTKSDAKDAKDAKSDAKDAKSDVKSKTRMEILQSIIKGDKKFIGISNTSGTSGSVMNITLKKFYYADGKDILKRCRIILDESINFPYLIDGLIFTPANFPVGATKSNGKYSLMYKSWDYAIKWKPNITTDFLVIMKGDVEVSNIDKGMMKYRLCELYTSYNMNKTLDPLKILKGEQLESIFCHRKFAECYLPIVVNSNGKEVVITETHDVDGAEMLSTELSEEIHNNTIVEFSYTPKDSNGERVEELFRWKPILVRHDKTDDYINSGGRIVGTANAFETAESNLKEINDPVTKEMITGLQGVGDYVLPENIIEDDVYNKNINKSLNRDPMRKFHNKWVKDMYLYKRFYGTERLFEIACGQAGDMGKWIRNDYRTIVGIDVNHDNLFNSNPNAGSAYHRLKELRNRNKRLNILFMQMDAKKAWNNKYIESIEDDVSRNFASVVFGLVRKSEIKEEALLPFYKLASADSLKFNVVSCMFAIHYMFETTTTLNNFVKNVSDLLNVGGYFIGTCLDGYLVHQALKGKTEINGFYYGENGEQIRNWGIVKKYDRYELKNHLKNIGKAIEVYMESFGQWLEEYLVDYDMLVEYLAKENIRPVISPKELELLGLNASTGSFKEIYNEIEHPEEDGDLDGFNEMFKEYSFMNRWFIFKKY